VVRTVVVGGMPGWQIILIALVTAILVSMLAVIFDRARAPDGIWPRRVDDADI
jgi:lipopolysaccharide export LptBFGC system permease protein LptF